MSISIRLAKPDDIPSIVSFIKNARAVMFPMLDQESRDRHARLELEKFQQTYLDNPSHGAFLTAHSEDKLIATIGYVAYDDRFPELHLGCEGVVEVVRLYVDPAWRRGGLASRLMSDLEQMARQAGFNKLYLHSHPFLEGAVRFWEKQGFSVLKVDVDDLVWQTTHMSKSLTG